MFREGAKQNLELELNVGRSEGYLWSIFFLWLQDH